MPHEAKAIVYETDGWFMALCNDYPGVTGEGKTREECIADLTSKLEATSTDAQEAIQQGG